MIIVSDTGPLAYLVEIGIVDCLPTLYGDVYIPPTVFAELGHPKSPASAWTSHPPEWLIVMAPQTPYGDRALDLGEREAIALALELGADRVLMDETRGRTAARACGLQVAGTLAVIVDAASRAAIDGHAALDRLSETNFYATPELLSAVRSLLSSSARPDTR